MKTNAVLLLAVCGLLALAQACVFDSNNVVVHGENAQGQLGLGFSSCAIATPFQVDFHDAIVVDAAFTSTAAFYLTSTGEVRRSENGVISTVAGATSIKAISAGADHVLMLNNNGEVYVMGGNANGQLGLGDFTARTTPTLLIALSAVTSISAGSSHSIFVLRDGRVFVTGNNADGQLSLGTYVNAKVPTQVAELEDIVSASAGKSHSLFVNRDGSVFVAGSNSNGEACLGTSEGSVLRATRITNSILLKTIVGAVAGNKATFILTEEGRVYSCGANANGELALGDKADRNVPTMISGFISQPVAQISAGSSSVQFLTTEGKVFASGSGKSGALGLGDFSGAVFPVLRDSLNHHTVCALSHGVESNAVAALLGHQ